MGSHDQYFVHFLQFLNGRQSKLWTQNPKTHLNVVKNNFHVKKVAELGYVLRWPFFKMSQNWIIMLVGSTDD